jgi:hypothetical protein
VRALPAAAREYCKKYCLSEQVLAMLADMRWQVRLALAQRRPQPMLH